MPLADSTWQLASLFLGIYMVGTAFGLLASVCAYAVFPARPGLSRQNPVCIIGFWALAFVGNAAMWRFGSESIKVMISKAAFHELMPRLVSFPDNDWRELVFLNCGAVILGIIHTTQMMRNHRSNETLQECIYIVAGGAGLFVLTLVPFQMPIRNLFFASEHFMRSRAA